MMVWVPAAYRGNLALYNVLSGLVNQWFGDLVFYAVSANYDGFGAAVFVRVVNESFVFLRGLLCKLRLGQCLQRVELPRARQPKEIDDQGPRRETQS